jgi:nucleotidyltransferase substrate binding protein (TIGR01987 family)
MAWKLMQDVLEYEGNLDFKGVKDVIRVALQRGIISEGELWMEMVEKRNHLAHGYNTELDLKAFERIKKYFIGS